MKGIKIQAFLCAFMFFAGMMFLAVPARGEEFAIAFTGQANAALYPCHCPVNPEGGVARRGSALKKLRTRYPDLLVVEAGWSFASGPKDSNSQNLPLDMRRTEVYLGALKSMGTDAVLLSSQEFIFGLDFLKRFNGLPFVTSNVDGVGAPFILKKNGRLSVGVIGLTDFAANERVAGWRYPRQSIEDAVKSLKKQGVDFIVLLSALTSDEDDVLAADVKGINVVINGGANYGTVAVKEVGNTIMVKTWWQAGKIGVLSFEASGKNIKVKKLEAIGLGADVSDDPDITSILPVCFQVGDCKKVSGKVPRCENAGENNARCFYAEIPAVSVTVIVPKVCRTCRSETALDNLKKMFGDIKTSDLYEDNVQAKELIKNLRLKMLPAYIFDETVESLEAFPGFSQSFDKIGSSYVFKPEVSGVSYFIGRNRIPRRLDVFFDFNYPELGLLCDRLKNLRERHHDLSMHFHFLMAWDAERGFMLRRGSREEDKEEFRRAAAVDALYPDKFLDYIKCRSEKRNPALWQLCDMACGIDSKKISDITASSESDKLLKERIRLTQELGVAIGPTFLVDNVEVFSIASVPSIEEFENVILENKSSNNKRSGHEK